MRAEVLDTDIESLKAMAVMNGFGESIG